MVRQSNVYGAGAVLLDGNLLLPLTYPLPFQSRMKG
jgi:hypothetical protein